MRIFNETKTQEIKEENVNYLTEKLVQDKLFIKHHDEIAEVPKKSHYEIVKEYPNGGRDVVEVIDVEFVAKKEAYDEFEDILRIEKLSQEELLDNLRNLREEKCFPIVNRGLAWYSKLSSEQNLELTQWYNDWLDITDKNLSEIESIIPKKPEWLR